MRVVDGTSEPERWVDRATMAGLMGVSVRTLDRMVADGTVPSVTWGRRTRRFLPSLVYRAQARQLNEEAA